MSCSVYASSVSWTSRVKPNLTLYDKLLGKNKGPLTVFDDQLPVGGKWGMWSFYFFPFPSSHSHSLFM